MLRLTLKCPECGTLLPVDAPNAPAEAICGACKTIFPLTVSDDVRSDQSVDTCPLCRGSDFYQRKDFNPKLGLTVVIIGALVSAGFYWHGLDLVAYSVLGMAALIDLLVYGRLKDITVCYRCHTEFRGGYPVVASVFDLATADELELDWAREWENRVKRQNKK